MSKAFLVKGCRTDMIAKAAGPIIFVLSIAFGLGAVPAWADGSWIDWGWYRAGQIPTASTGSLILFPAAPSPRRHRAGSQIYVLDGDIVTANGVSGRFWDEDIPLLSFKSPGNSLFKYAGGQHDLYYQAVMQTDGNFVVYRFDANGNRTPTFWTNTGGKVDGRYWKLVPQADGNLVLYETDLAGETGSAIWASNTAGIRKPAPGHFGLSMQQDGNLVLYLFYEDGSCDPVWASDNTAVTGAIVWNH
jgi:hypothetical protein